MAAFIVFEGGDGSGKSTQCRHLLRRLRREGYAAIVTREPGGTPSGNAVRRWLKGHRDLTPLSELLLFEAARAQLVSTVILPSIRNGTTVVCDRHTASTVAYQGYGRGLDLEVIRQLNRMAVGELVPDLTILLDLSVESALDRKEAKSGDVFDTAPVEFHRQVRQGYLSQAADGPERWLVLDATQPPRALAQEVWEKVRPLL